jgi:hypothetical protein
MNPADKYLVAAFLLAAMLFTTVAQAMEIQQFDKMAADDQDEYVAELIIGAQQVLKDASRPDDAAQVHKLFTTVNPRSKISLGRGEFEENLARGRLFDVKRVDKDPNARRLEVEDAMIVTLKKNGIELPPSFLTVASGFKPKLPPTKEKKDKKN